MIFFQGIDLLDIRRIKKTYEKFGEKFISKIFSKNELKFLANELPKNRLIEKIASGFAAKEAASKAIGTGFRKGISFLDFEIYYDALNKPFINLNSKIESRINHIKSSEINTFVSISNEKNFVVALVTITISK